MWVFSKTGFFKLGASAVGDGMGALTIKSSFEGDLERLRDSMMPELRMLGASAEEEEEDEVWYEAIAPRDAIRRVFGAMVDSIDYECLCKALRMTDEARAQIYKQTEEALEDAQEQAQTWAEIDARMARSGVMAARATWGGADY